MRSGDIHINDGRSRLIGIGGYWWSSMSSSRYYSGGIVPSAYKMDVYSIATVPSGGPVTRWYGYPLSCLAISDTQ